MGVHLYFTDTLIALTLGKRCYSKYYCMEMTPKGALETQMFVRHSVRIMLSKGFLRVPKSS